MTQPRVSLTCTIKFTSTLSSLIHQLTYTSTLSSLIHLCFNFVLSEQGRIQEFGWGGQIWWAQSASLYGGLGALPQVGSRGKAPGQGRSPPEADAILAFRNCICEIIFTFDSEFHRIREWTTNWKFAILTTNFQNLHWQKLNTELSQLHFESV